MVRNRDTYERVFVALKLPNSVLQQIQSINACLDERIVRKVKLSNLHLTLNFLGETKICHIKFLQSELIKHLGRLAPFKLKLDSIGSFPNGSNPKIVWMGVNGNLRELNYIQSQITKVVAGFRFGYKEDKFTPHITLARIKNGNNLKQNEVFSQDIQVVEKSLLETFPFEVKSVVIINSVHSKNGYQYDEIGAIYLKNQTC